MKHVRLIGLISVFSLLISLIIFSACKKRENLDIDEASEQVGTEISISQQQESTPQSDVDENIDKFLELVLEKEKELKEKEKNLEEKLADLEKKQAQLSELDSELKKAELKFENFRLLSYIIFAIGLVCIIAGLLMIVLRGKLKKEIPATEVKPEKKERKKEASKPVVGKKALKEEPPKPVVKKKKNKTEIKPK